MGEGAAAFRASACAWAMTQQAWGAIDGRRRGWTERAWWKHECLRACDGEQIHIVDGYTVDGSGLCSRRRHVEHGLLLWLGAAIMGQSAVVH